MKKLLILLLIVFCNQSFGQTIDYFYGNKRYCELSEKNLELWKLGFDALKFKDYYKYSSAAFLKILKTDSTSCDAYFMAGYTFRIRGMIKEALTHYYMADSLSQNKAIEFKQNLAVTSFAAGNIKLSRKKYNEMVQYFPENPEGYYGIALTSTIIGDVDNGLENINKAAKIYTSSNKKLNTESQLILALLNTRKGNFSLSIPYFEDCYSRFKNEDEFNSHYSYSLLKVSEANKDEKMKEKAIKIYNKIKNKNEIREEIRNEFKT